MVKKLTLGLGLEKWNQLWQEKWAPSYGHTKCIKSRSVGLEKSQNAAVANFKN